MATMRVSKLADLTSVVATANYIFTADSHQAISAQAVWTATTAAFTLTLQSSIDNATWNNFASATAISDASGNVTWNMAATVDQPYWRVLATRTSGTLLTLKVYVANVER